VKKLQPLFDHLSALTTDRWEASFRDIQSLSVNPLLPPAAFKYPAWWANDRSPGRQSWSWADAGFVTAKVNLPGGEVTFVRVGPNLGPRVMLSRMVEKLDDDAALVAAAQSNTREIVRAAFDRRVENVTRELRESNLGLYKRITDDPALGEALKNFLFDLYLGRHRNAEELIKRGESKSLEFKSTLRWSLKEDRRDDKGVTHAALRTIAAFLNTEGGDLLIGVADDGSIIGIGRDQLKPDDKFMRHLMQVVRNGMGDRVGTCIDPKTQTVQDKTICVVSCQRSPEPVFLKWKGIEASPGGDFFVRNGPGTVKLAPDSTKDYIRTRFRFLGEEDELVKFGIPAS
jgi:hypothetical protein